MSTYAAFLDELEKIAYGSEPSPRGGFLLASHGRVTIPLRAPSPGAARGVPMAGQEKDGDFGDYGSYNPADFKRVDINKKASALTPAGRLASAQRKATGPNALGRSGPSVAKISKIPGSGRPLAGAIQY